MTLTQRAMKYRGYEISMELMAGIGPRWVVRLNGSRIGSASTEAAAKGIARNHATERKS